MSWSRSESPIHPQHHPHPSNYLPTLNPPESTITVWIMEKLPTELFIEIFKCLPGSAQLLRVNQQWVQHLMPMIWKAVDDSRLMNVTPGRRPIYASFIRSLKLAYYKKHIRKKLEGLDFPRLNTLISWHIWHFDSSCLTGYFVPTMRSVTLESFADQGLLERLATHCPQLSHIELTLLAPTVTAEQILHLTDV
ncbi:hypothetical protein BDW74DRAFT_100165 [Aspergillus multicolor]|uniref:uncharacterized protein n=1 Tax=Aspergillus multicolor TaxID=41759 RepID=UPI003CCE17CD